MLFSTIVTGGWVYYIFTTFPKCIGKDCNFASVIKTNALWDFTSSSITLSLSLSSSPSTRRGGLGSSMSEAPCSGSWFGHYLATAWARNNRQAKRQTILKSNPLKFINYVPRTNHVSLHPVQPQFQVAQHRLSHDAVARSTALPTMQKHQDHALT